MPDTLDSIYQADQVMVVGPVHYDPGWQAHAADVYDASQFNVNCVHKGNEAVIGIFPLMLLARQ